MPAANALYERHVHKDLKFPLIFHRDTLKASDIEVYTHYQENIELLFVLEGELAVTINEKTLFAQAGQIVIILPDELHTLKTVSKISVYDCLIPDTECLRGWGLNLTGITFPKAVHNQDLAEAFGILYKEMSEMAPYYKAAAMSTMMGIMTALFRRYAVATSIPQSTPQSLEVIKLAIEWLKTHYFEECSTDQLADAIGYSKSYICHRFKEVTGVTVVNYRNLLRCEQARKLLLAGNNVSEASLAVGFQNLSYFTRIYKKQRGILPSNEGPHARQEVLFDPEKEAL